MDIDDKVVNLDNNYDDPQLCATFACDIYKHLRASEVVPPIHFNCTFKFAFAIVPSTISFICIRQRKGLQQTSWRKFKQT